MRSAWLPVGLVLLGVVGAPLACGKPFEFPGSTTSGAGGAPSTSGTGGGGGGAESSAQSTAASTSNSSSSSGGATCMTPQDCPGTSTLCGQITCTNGMCGLQPLQGNVMSSSQIYGDCHVVMCDKGHVVNKVDDTETYDDGNGCTNNVCMNGVASNPVKTENDSKCGLNNYCSAKGACVECRDEGDCMSPTPKCQGNRCVMATCTDGMMNGAETDEDCGGVCAPCGDGKLCDMALDCVSSACSIKPGEGSKTCHHDCADGVKNGTETGADCGGKDCVKRCATGFGCLTPADCKGGVCKVGLCLDPTCNDGVKNGTEADIDCGPSCAACPI